MLRLKKVLLIFLGSIFIIIGVIGLLLPIVPTMPFLIIAGIFYIRGSDTLYRKLIKTKYFGPHIESYVERREVTRKFKISTLLLLWIPSSITIIFIVDSWYIRLIPFSLVILTTWHILLLKTVDEREIIGDYEQNKANRDHFE